MNTKLFLHATLLAALVLPLPALADTETVNGIPWAYTVTDGKALIGHVFSFPSWSPAVPTSTTGAITIPYALGGCPVTSIEENAFEGCRGITSVIIPDTVTTISDNAFYGCSRLASVTIPNSVTTIGASAFEWCVSLKSLKNPPR